MQAELSEGDAARIFKDVVGAFPTGVTVITALRDGKPIGFTCQSFFSVSLSPLLVGFSVAKTSTTFPLIRENVHCCINVLHQEQQHVSQSFSRSGTDKWQGIDWTPSPVLGLPVIGDPVAWIDCRVSAEYDAGDHLIVVADVVDMKHSPDTAPLVFLRGRYVRLAPPEVSHE
jgi:3-hydroxy-9,10-secoandrosta-1,3,5(10)-triene-9,17-dione monooxygenase reductase component